ncbi:Frag1/DRAM/Sfk1 family-domain-containing protein [Trametes polyzona]|nr:Frag1/DRAM/Sfk1 family-domain-containing protein [Trametes polyzona]
MLGLPHEHHHWLYVWIPLFGAFIWFGTLWALLITWLASGRPHYVSQDGNIAYISDVGADILKPLFIVGCAITGLSFFLSSAIERWLRHEGRLVANMRRRERVLASLAVFFAFVGMCGLILLSIFDTKRYTKEHRVFLLVFIVGVGLSAIFTVIEYRWISRDFVEIRKLKTLYIVKGTIALILILLAIAFAITLFQATDPGAIIEWTIAFGFTFYMLTFFFDLRMSKGVHKGELSRQRLLAMQQHGQGVTAAREANVGNGAVPSGDAYHENGAYSAAGPNGYTQMSHANGPASYGRGNAPIAQPANARVANRASAAYP